MAHNAVKCKLFAMNQTEEIFVKNFIARNRRERWLEFLPHETKRQKQLHNLSHTLTTDLALRFVYDKENLPSEISIQVQKLLTEWKKTQQLCHIISHNYMDGEKMRLEDAENDYGLSTGAIIIIVPDKLAYYHTERSNLNKQPFYVLFRS
jgi:hypothetical protein